VELQQTGSPGMRFPAQQKARHEYKTKRGRGTHRQGVAIITIMLTPYAASLRGDIIVTLPIGAVLMAYGLSLKTEDSMH
jgi:hypothetical protein